MAETLEGWTSSKLIRFVQDYLLQNPVTQLGVLTVDELTVNSKLTLVDQAEAAQQAQDGLREKIYTNKAASASLTLTTAFQDVAGLSYTVEYAGLYVCHATFDFEHSVVGGGFAQGALLKNGSDQGGNPSLRDAAVNIRAAIGQTWLVQCAKADVLKVQAKKTINAGTATAYSPTSTLVVHKL